MFYPLPEQLISKDPEFYLRHKMNSWGRKEDFHSSEAMKEYIRCFCNSDAIHSTCEDYRASSTIDLTHDEEDKTKLQMPLQAIWGKEGFVGKNYNVISEWRKVAQNVNGAEVPGGHYVVKGITNGIFKNNLTFFKKLGVSYEKFTYAREDHPFLHLMAWQALHNLYQRKLH